MVSDRHDPLSDSYRRLRSIISFIDDGAHRADDRGAIIVIVSPGPGDGKSSIAANLASAFAETGDRIVAVNSDFRRPTLSQRLSIVHPEPIGFELDEIVHAPLELVLTPINADDLSVLDLSAMRNHNPGDLARVTARVLPRIAAVNDYVVVDTSPIGATAEVLEFVPLADTIVMVVRLGHTSIQAARRTAETIRTLSTANVVLVLIGGESDETSYYYYSNTPPEPEATPKARKHPRPAKQPKPAKAAQAGQAANGLAFAVRAQEGQAGPGHPAGGPGSASPAAAARLQRPLTSADPSARRFSRSCPVVPRSSSRAPTHRAPPARPSPGPAWSRSGSETLRPFPSHPGTSRIRPRTSRIRVRAADPTLPLVASTRPAASARMCWHWAADRCSRPFAGSTSISTSEANPRTVDVSGTTWTTLGPASNTRCAVTTTAGWRNPASRPAGTPRSKSTTSPEVSIEPLDLLAGQVAAEIGSDLVLA